MNIFDNAAQRFTKIRSNPRFRWCASAALFIVGIGFLLAQDRVASLTGYPILVEHAQVLIDDGMEDNQRTFLIFSAIKASLAMIEGSSVGVGIEVQVGDLIQPAYDYVDYFWKIFLTAFVVMGFYKILLDAGILMLGFPLIGLGLCILSASMFSSIKRWNPRALARRLILMGLLITHALPFALLVSDRISQTYVSELKASHHENINAFQLELVNTRTRFLALKEEISFLNPGGSIERIEARLVAVAQSVASSFQLSFLSFMYYVLIVVFELLILPFCTAFILYLVSRRIMEGLIVPAAPVVLVQSAPEAVAIK